MKKLFSLYSAVILLAFMVANHEGYAVGSLFGTQYHGKPGEPGYQRQSPIYHK